MLPEIPHSVVQPSRPEPPVLATEGAPPAAQSQDQIRAADALFAQHQKDSSALGVFGMWSGALLLHDLAKEHFTESVDEEEEHEKKEPKLKEE